MTLWQRLKYLLAIPDTERDAKDGTTRSVSTACVRHHLRDELSRGADLPHWKKTRHRRPYWDRQEARPRRAE